MKRAQFQKLRLNIHELDVPDLVDHFPELKQSETFSKYSEWDRNYVIRYVVYMYDMNSDLVVEEPDILKRKERAMELSEYPDKDPKRRDASERREEVMGLADERVLEMVVEYLKIQNNRLWMLYLSCCQYFISLNRKIMDNIGDSQKRTNKEGEEINIEVDEDKILRSYNLKTQCAKDADDLLKKIESYEQRLFGGDEDLLEKAESMRVSPEKIADHV